MIDFLVYFFGCFQCTLTRVPTKLDAQNCFNIQLMILQSESYVSLESKAQMSIAARLKSRPTKKFKFSMKNANEEPVIYSSVIFNSENGVKSEYFMHILVMLVFVNKFQALGLLFSNFLIQHTFIGIEYYLGRVLEAHPFPFTHFSIRIYNIAFILVKICVTVLKSVI